MPVGLFGIVREGGLIKNITLNNSYIYANKGLSGGIVGYNEGTIYRCKVENTTIESGTGTMGGIAGLNNGVIKECSTLVNIYGVCPAGIAGSNGVVISGTGLTYNRTLGEIYRCYSDGYFCGSQAAGITTHNGSYSGEGYIYDSYSTAKIESTLHLGALVSVQSYQGRGGHIYNSYYMNPSCTNMTSVVNR